MGTSFFLLLLVFLGLVVALFPRGLQNYIYRQNAVVGISKKIGNVRLLYIRLIGFLFIVVSTLIYFGVL